jgi:hypothetical protein
MSNSNQVTPITENEAAESLLSLINATSKAPQLPFENVSKKDKPAALNRGQENTNGASILVNQVSPNHRIQSADDPNPPRPSSPPRSPSQSEAKILNMSFLKRPASIPSRVIYQNNHTDEASSIDSNASSRRNRAFEHGKVLPSSKKGSAITTTPEVLMHLLLDPENYSAMHFLPSGDALVICNVKEFLKSLMNKYFRLTKFGCFIGKLERWGFTHTSEGLDPELHVFRHPLFRKNDPESLNKMKYCPRSSKGMNRSTFPYLGTNSRTQKGSSPTSIDSASFQSIQDTMNRHVELSTMYSDIQRSQDVSQRASPIFVAPAVATKNIVDAAIACLQRDGIMPRNAITPVRNPIHHILSNPYSMYYTVAHRESVFNHQMMLNNLQALNGSNSSCSQNS